MHNLALAAARTAHTASQANVVSAHPVAAVTVSLGLLAFAVGALSFYSGGTSVTGFVSWLTFGLGGGGAASSIHELAQTAEKGVQAIAHGTIIAVSISTALVALCFGGWSWWNRRTSLTGAVSWWLVGVSGGGVLGALVLGFATSALTMLIGVVTPLVTG